MHVPPVTVAGVVVPLTRAQQEHLAAAGPGAVRQWASELDVQFTSLLKPRIPVLWAEWCSINRLTTQADSDAEWARLGLGRVRCGETEFDVVASTRQVVRLLSQRCARFSREWKRLLSLDNVLAIYQCGGMRPVRWTYPKWTDLDDIFTRHSRLADIVAACVKFGLVSSAEVDRAFAVVQNTPRRVATNLVTSQYIREAQTRLTQVRVETPRAQAMARVTPRAHRAPGSQETLPAVPTAQPARRSLRQVATIRAAWYVEEQAQAAIARARDQATPRAQTTPRCQGIAPSQATVRLSQTSRRVWRLTECSAKRTLVGLVVTHIGPVDSGGWVDVFGPDIPLGSRWRNHNWVFAAVA